LRFALRLLIRPWSCIPTSWMPRIESLNSIPNRDDFKSKRFRPRRRRTSFSGGNASGYLVRLRHFAVERSSCESADFVNPGVLELATLVLAVAELEVKSEKGPQANLDKTTGGSIFRALTDYNFS